MPLQVGCVIFKVWELLDLTGPLSVLMHAASLSTDREVSFSVIGPSTTIPVESASHFPTIPAFTFTTAPQFDLILVPGGFGTLTACNDQSLLNFLRAQAPKAQIIASICTGSSLLANAGLLENRRATSNKAVFGLMAQFGSNKVTYVRSARFVEDGNVWTASGVSAGVDMAFAIAGKLFGAEVASAVSKSWGYEPLGPTHDPFCDLHPPPNTIRSAIEYGAVKLIGWKLVDNTLSTLLNRRNKRRVATILIDGFALPEVAFVNEALLSLTSSHWYEILHARNEDGGDRVVARGGYGEKFSDVIAVQTDRGFSISQPLADSSTDVVFVPSVSDADRPEIQRVVDAIEEVPKSVNVIVSGNIAQKLQAKLGLEVIYDETGWVKHNNYFFAKDSLGGTYIKSDGLTYFNHFTESPIIYLLL
ncbi:class I glutamine amidotransferase-like protein [Cladochytrium replicatum]|nr:class I glutamine amidotransferase-like protein [Cladochytrium replicatum]